jgi:hypothetical protein
LLSDAFKPLAIAFQWIESSVLGWIPVIDSIQGSKSPLALTSRLELWWQCHTKAFWPLTEADETISARTE